MVLKRITLYCLLLLMMGGSTLEMSCTRQGSLQKKTKTYQRKMRKGKPVPCPCNEK